jgi:IS5 family transposase
VKSRRAKLRLRGAVARDQAQATVRRITDELAGLAQRAADDAQRLLANARRALRGAHANAPSLPGVRVCATRTPRGCPR